jgi:two-component system chemotaxis sensor kinase CheA
MAEYKELFLAEAGDHLATMNTSLVMLEKNPAQAEHVGEVFRATHTLKSMAAAMHYQETAALCHAMEDLLDAIRHGKVTVEPCTDLLYECVDALGTTLKALSEGANEHDTASLVDRLTRLVSLPPEPGDPTSAAQAAAPASAATATIDKVRTIGVKVERLDRLMNLGEELLINRMGLDLIAQRLRDPALSVAVNSLGRMLTDLQYHVMQSRMVPVGFLFERFPRMVRDLAKQEAKEVDINAEGSDIELDRTVIDEMGECLVHLLRNAVDHGIESPTDRAKAGKAPRGQIKLTATRTRESAIIEVADDGAGLDCSELKRAGLERGLLRPNASQEEVVDTVFQGNSLAQSITAVSGRGLGLNIVRSKIKSIGGSIRVESLRHKHTRFIMEFPLTLAIVKVLFVQVGKSMYGVPVTSVERLVTVSEDAIKGLLDYEAIVMDGQEIPLTRLSVLLHTPSLAVDHKQRLIIVKRGSERLGLIVDAVTIAQDVIVKPLTRHVRDSRYFSGCTIIGSGEVVLILDTGHLILSKRTDPHARACA